jgi:hypothetical protein
MKGHVSYTDCKDDDHTVQAHHKENVILTFRRHERRCSNSRLARMFCKGRYPCDDGALRFHAEYLGVVGHFLTSNISSLTGSM